MVTHNRHPQSFDRLLAELAALYGVQTGYRDSRRRRCESPPESVVWVLSALGCGLGEHVGVSGDAGHRLTTCQIEAAIRERKAELRSRVLEPVVVAWGGVLPPISVRLLGAGQRSGRTDRGSGMSGPGGPSFRGEVLGGGVASSGGRLKLTIAMEGGAEEQWEVGRDSAGVASTGMPKGQLPLGYHRLRVEAGATVAEAFVIAAPRRCWASEQAPEQARNPATGGSSREWGVFAPLYALRSERNWGAGDLADLGKLREWVAAAGGSVVATLPLLAAYLDQPFEPAPYRPVSRLFWNEFYLAVDQIPEWEQCAAARELWGSQEIQDSARALRAEPLVDYRGVMAVKRRVLEALSRCFFASADARRKEAFSAYVRARPEVEEYAAFRAEAEAAGADWRSWQDVPATSRADGRVPADAAEARHTAGAAEAKQYHLYCQWQMDEQLGRLSGRGRPGASGERGGDGEGPSGFGQESGRPATGLFLDLPLGVHPGGFDTWRWPELFASGMSTGAPPDGFFATGQGWNSPPLHPERIREQGHEYFARCVRHHMHHARYLRIDHVMSLHRLFWVPEGMEPAQGVYVSYPADELYAVLCLESHRNRTVVVGEDLGTVPAGVRPSMRRHRVLGTWVLQSSLRPRAAAPVGAVPRHAVASLNTHDMFPFAGFLRGDDIVARVETGQLDREGARREAAARHRLLDRLATFLPAAPAAPSAGQGVLARGFEYEPASQAGRAGAIDLAELATQAESEGPGDPEAGPAESAGAVLLARTLAYLAAGPAALVVVNLEDLLLETRPQNMPGTGANCGNWRRKAVRSLAEPGWMRPLGWACDAHDGD